MPEFFESEVSLFAEVILPLPLSKNYTYGIPDELKSGAAIGKRVEIQFGKRKIYAGLIKRLHTQAPKEYKIKPILSVLDSEPIVTEENILMAFCLECGHERKYSEQPVLDQQTIKSRERRRRYEAQKHANLFLKKLNRQID